MARVALVQTTPDTVLDDVARAMDAAGYEAALDRSAETALKINVSWHHWYPACSTTPWQLDGAIRKLRADGFAPESLYGAHNRTVVVDAHVGERANKHLPVVTVHGLRNIHLYEDDAWVRYEPKGRLRTLHEVYPEGVRIPQRLIGSNIIHLPTVKTHVFTHDHGRHEERLWRVAVRETTLLPRNDSRDAGGLADDSAGDSPGHIRRDGRHVRWRRPGTALHAGAGAESDAGRGRPGCRGRHERPSDGVGPFDIPFLRMAHEDGLGTADAREIEVVGADIEQVKWQVAARQDTFASRGQKLIYWGPLKRLEKMLLRTVIAPWSYAASRLYHDVYWYNAVGRGRIRQALNGPWGELFQRYPMEAGQELPTPVKASEAAPRT